MSRIVVRRAGTLDAGAIAEVLNASAAEGSNATAGLLRDWIEDGGFWHIAETGMLGAGAQWFGPRLDLPDDCCEIATFVPTGDKAIEIGSALFEATRAQARAQHFRRIVARIGVDNGGALAYYGSRGFEMAENEHGAAAGRTQTLKKCVMIYRL